MGERYQPRIRIYPEFGSDLKREIEEYVKRELGYSDEDLENLEVYDLKTLVAQYEEIIEEMIGSDAWKRLSGYIDVEAMIRDDVISGYLTEFEVRGLKLFLREA